MELRLYSWCNFYISSIQHGIQTGHAAVDLVRKYARPANGSDYPNTCASSIKDIHDINRVMVNKWADTYKTFYVMNGGDWTGVVSVLDILKNSGFPYAAFKEETGALCKDETITCAVAIIPESIYEARALPSSSQDLPIYSYYPKYECAGETEISTCGFIYDKNNEFYPLINLIRNSRFAQ